MAEESFNFEVVATCTDQLIDQFCALEQRVKESSLRTLPAADLVARATELREHAEQLEAALIVDMWATGFLASVSAFGDHVSIETEALTNHVRDTVDAAAFAAVGLEYKEDD